MDDKAWVIKLSIMCKLYFNAALRRVFVMLRGELHLLKSSTGFCISGYSLTLLNCESLKLSNQMTVLWALNLLLPCSAQSMTTLNTDKGWSFLMKPLSTCLDLLTAKTFGYSFLETLSSFQNTIYVEKSITGTIFWKCFNSTECKQNLERCRTFCKRPHWFMSWVLCAVSDCNGASEFMDTLYYKNSDNFWIVERVFKWFMWLKLKSIVQIILMWFCWNLK